VKAKILILVQVVLLVSLMGGYATTIHGVGRMGEERPEGQVPSLDAEDAAEFRVSIGDHSVGGPIMAFNPQANEYLVVWSDERSGNRQVWGSLVDAYGDPIGTDFLISGESHSAGPYPTVAWGEDRWGNGEYFVVWQAYVYEGTWVTYGRRFCADGTPIGEATAVISGYTTSACRKSVVYNSQDDEYFVVLDGEGNNLAARVSVNGEHLANVQVPSHTHDVGYNSVRNEYLLLYWENVGTPDFPDYEMQVQRMSNVGTYLGDPIMLYQWTPNLYTAEPGFIAYNPTADEYLVSWWHQTTPTDDWYPAVYSAWRLSGDGQRQQSFDIEVFHALDPRILIGPMVYNPVADEYLATWENGSQRISGDGQLLGDVIPYGGNTIGYSSEADRYLLARRHESNIYCRYLTSDGSAVGVERAIVGSSQNQSQPAVSYHKGIQEYLIVWRDERDNSSGDIYAQRIGADGALRGTNFTLEDVYAYPDSSPIVAYNDQDEEWLVVWQENRGFYPPLGDDLPILVGQRVSGYGNLLGERFRLDAYPMPQESPTIAYNGQANQYLVVWSCAYSGGIYGKRVAADGTMLGDTIPIATGNSQRNPDVAYNSGRNEYLVVWEEDNRIYARRVLVDGTLPDDAFIAGDHVGDDPAIAYNSKQDQYLLVWDYGNFWYWNRLLIQRLAKDGEPVGEILVIDPDELLDESWTNADVVYSAPADRYVIFCLWSPGYERFYLKVYQVDASGNVGGERIYGRGIGSPPRPYAPYLACSDEAGCVLVWQEGIWWQDDYDIWGCIYLPSTPAITATPSPTPSSTPSATPSAHLSLPLIFKNFPH